MACHARLVRQKTRKQPMGQKRGQLLTKPVIPIISRSQKWRRAGGLRTFVGLQAEISSKNKLFSIPRTMAFYFLSHVAFSFRTKGDLLNSRIVVDDSFQAVRSLKP